LRETLQDFLDLYVDAGDKIEQAIGEQRYHDAEIVAHTLKGLGAIFAAVELNRSAAEVEKALRHEQLDQIDQQVSELNDAIDQMVGAILEFLQQ